MTEDEPNGLTPQDVPQSVRRRVMSVTKTEDADSTRPWASEGAPGQAVS